MNSKEIMKYVGVGTVIAVVKVGVDYFSRKNHNFGILGKCLLLVVGDLINDQIKAKVWYPFKP